MRHICGTCVAAARGEWYVRSFAGHTRAYQVMGKLPYRVKADPLLSTSPQATTRPRHRRPSLYNSTVVVAQNVELILQGCLSHQQCSGSGCEISPSPSVSPTNRIDALEIAKSKSRQGVPSMLNVSAVSSSARDRLATAAFFEGCTRTIHSRTIEMHCRL